MHKISVQLRVVIVFLVLVLLSGVLVGSSGAAPNAISRVTISDVRDVAFTVSWVTSSTSNGTVLWGTTQIPAPSTAAADAVSSTTTHYVQIVGLNPSTTYYFYVTSGSDTDNNGGLYYQVTTGPTVLSNPGNVIRGFVYQSDLTTAVPNAIVYLQLQDADGVPTLGSSQLVSARANSSGFWTYNLGNVRTSNFQNVFIANTGTDNLRLIGQGGSQGTRGLDPAPFIIPVPSTTPFRQDIVLNQSPTAVTLASFTGQSYPGSTRLVWATANETGLIGFNLYRSDTQGGVKHKLNSSLIPAQTPGSLTGNAYQYRDATVERGQTYFYWIELVMTGTNQDYGPVALLAPYGVFLPMVKH